MRVKFTNRSTISYIGHLIRTVSVCLIITLFGVSAAYAQNMTITGQVTSQESGEPLPGVNVILNV